MDAPAGQADVRRGGRLARIRGIFTYVLGGLFASLAIVAVAIGWRLSEGPIKVSFLTPYVQQSLSALPEGWSIDIGDTYVDWDSEAESVRIRAEDVGFINAVQQRVLSVPNASFSIHGEPLLAGRVEPKEVSAIGVSLVLTRSAESGWRLGTAIPSTEAEATTTDTVERGVAELVADLFGDQQGGDGGVLGRLQQLTLIDTSLSIADQTNGRVYQLNEGRLTLRGLDGGISVRADGEFATRDLVLPLSTSFIYRPAVQEVAGSVRFSAVEIASASEALGGPAILSGLTFPVSGTGFFNASEADGLGPVKLDLAGGKGMFALPGHLADPVPVEDLVFKGTFSLDGLVLEAEELVYNAGDFVARATGTATFTEIGPDIRLAIESDSIPVVRVPAYWPVNHARNVRSWLLENLTDGTATDVVARLEMAPDMWSKPAPDESSFDVRFGFSGATVRLPDPFDPITDGNGQIRLNGRSIEISTIDGKLGPLTLFDGTVEIPDFAGSLPELQAEFSSIGSIRDSLNGVLRGEVSRGNSDLESLLDVSGLATVRISLGLPLTKDTALSDAAFSASAEMTDVVADDLFPGLPLKSNTLKLDLTVDTAKVAGTVQSGQSRLALNWTEHFAASAGIVREVHANGIVEVNDLERLGIGVGDYALGQINLVVSVRSGTDGTISGVVDADLTPALITLERPLWVKPQGAPADLSLEFNRFADGSTQLNKLRANAAGLALKGDVDLGVNGELLSVRLERADFAGSQVSVVARTGPEATLVIDINGPTLDLRPWLEETEDEGKNSDLTSSANLSIAVNSLILDDSTTIAEVVGQVTIQEPYPVGELRGTVNGQAGLQAKATQSGNEWRLSLESEDAGTVLRALDLTDAIQDGRLTLSAVASQADVVTGMARIEDFTLTETPTFARLLSLASFSGIGEALSGRGLSFSLAEAPFVYANGRLDVRKGRMAGPSVGLTADGFYDWDRDELRFVGNLIPAYSISQVLGQIPLLGAILGGDQGLFGVTYVVEGPSAKPLVKANPLSALAPGILRRMFLEPVDEKPIADPGTTDTREER